MIIRRTVSFLIFTLACVAGCAQVAPAPVTIGGRNDVGDASPVAGGATAFKLVGLILGLAVRSHTFGIVTSAYGGSRSIYSNFLGRGHDIVFQKDTAMEIGFGGRKAMPVPMAP